MLILSAFENENQRPTGSRAPNTPSRLHHVRVLVRDVKLPVHHVRVLVRDVKLPVHDVRAPVHNGTDPRCARHGEALPASRVD